jgi:hypothetical protein
MGTSVPIGTSTPTVASSTLTFRPIADAYVTSAIPNTNYGGSQNLRFDASPIVRSYLTFNVQGLSGTILSVKLKVYAGSSSSSGFKVYKVSNTSWGEKSITYSNAPALGSQIGSSGAITGSAWTTVDVTSLLTGSGTFSVALTGISTTAGSLSSRETTRAPQLIITTR